MVREGRSYGLIIGYVFLAPVFFFCYESTATVVIVAADCVDNAGISSHTRELMVM